LLQTAAGHRGSAVTSAIGGRQYVAEPTGWGSFAGAAQQSIWSKRAQGKARHPKHPLRGTLFWQARLPTASRWQTFANDCLVGNLALLA
jgi:hypothetical protein